MHIEHAKLCMAVAVAELGVWEVDLTTNSFTCSDQCKVHFGVSPDEPLTGERALELIHPEDRQKAKDAFWAAVATGAAYQAEYRVIDPAGRLRWIAAMGRYLQGGENRMLGVMLDISGRKQSAEILAQTVAKRTAQLQETINELEAFSYSISHDLRAPLRAMQGFSQALVEEYSNVLDARGQDYLQRINRAASRLDLLIRDILTYSRIAKAELKLVPIDLDRMIPEILRSYPELEAARKSIRIRHPLPAVVANEAFISQIVSNLVGNALKFVRPGVAPRVRIRAVTNGEMVRLWFEDNGLGIAPEHQQRIFAIFGRVYSEKEFPGSGIGLAIVRKAAERLGGKVGVESELGRGSRFWLTLRRAE